MDYKDLSLLPVSDVRAIHSEVYGPSGRKVAKRELLKGLKRYCIGGAAEELAGRAFGVGGGREHEEHEEHQPNDGEDSSGQVGGAAEDCHPDAGRPVEADATYRLMFDGGSRGNPGPSGCGWVIYNDADETELASGSRFLGTMTNNQAEYKGLEEGLTAARELGVLNGEGRGGLVVVGDSQLVVKQIRGEYRVKNEGLKPIWEKCRGIMKGMNVLEVKHTLRGENGRADQLANEAMDDERGGRSF